MSPSRTTARSRRGFTLIEMLATLVTIVALAAIALISYDYVTTRSRLSATLTDVRTISAAALNHATAEQADQLDRDLFVMVMSEVGREVVDGLGADAWRLGMTDDSPVQRGDFAVGFAVGSGAAQNTGGDRAAIVSSSGEYLVGQLLDLSTGSSTGASVVPKGTTPTDLLGNPRVLDDEVSAVPAGYLAPTGVVGEGDVTRIHVSWTAVPGAASYVAHAVDLEDRTSAQCSTDTPACTIENLSPGTRHSVTVTAVYPSGVSRTSTPVLVDLITAAPKAPAVSAATDGTWHAQWDGVEGATSYEVQWRLGDGEWTQGTAQDLTFTSPDSQLEATQTVTVQVRSLSAAGASAWSEPGQATRPLVAPGKPVVTIDGAGRWAATWAPVPGASEYVVELDTDGGQSTTRTVTSTSTSGDVGHGQTIRVRVRAVAGEHTSPFSPYGSATRAPGVPGTPSLTLADDGTWTATWASGEGARGYELSATVDGGQATTSATTQTTASGHLEPGQTLTVTVRSTVEGLTSSWTAPASITRAPSTPAAPAVTITHTDGAWSATWPAATGATGYTAQYRINGGTWTPAAVTSTTATAATQVPAGGTLDVRVRADGAAGTTSSWSPLGSAARVPSQVAAPAVTLDDATGAWTATWTPVAGATGYTAQYRINGGSWLTATVTGTSATSATNVPWAGAIEVRVQAKGGGSTASTWSGVATAHRAPAAPATPTVTVTDSTGAWTATWTPVAGATGYTAQYRINDGSWTNATVSGTSATAAATVARGSKIELRVQAKGGGSTASTWSGIATAHRAPSTPDAPTVTLDDATGTWSATWAAATGATTYTWETYVNGSRTASGTTGTTTYTATTPAQRGQLVEFRVQAKSTWGAVSAWSTKGSAARGPAVPEAPTVDVDDATGAWTASWTAPQAATGYDFRYRFNGGTWLTGTVTGTTATSATAVPWGAKMEAQVKARGANSTSSAWSATTTTVRVPATPAKPTVTVDDATGTWTATWTAAPGATGYTVERTVSGAAATTVTTTSLTATGTIAPGQAITVRVRASGQLSKVSGWSTAATATRSPATPGTPTVTVDDDTGAWTATWASATGATGYSVRYRVNGGSWVTSTQTGVVKTGTVEWGGKVEVQVQSTGQNSSTSGWSSTGSVVRKPQAPVVTATALSATQGKFTWPAAAGAANYYIGYRCNSADYQYVTTTSLSYTVTCEHGDIARVSVRAQVPGASSAFTASSVGLLVSQPTAGSTSPIVSYPNLGAKYSTLTCVSPAVPQTSHRTRLNGETAYSSWSTWTTQSGDTTTSHTRSVSDYSRTMDIELKARCFNPNSGRVSSETAAVSQTGLKHTIAAPTDVTATRNARQFRGSATCPSPNTTAMYEMTLVLPNYGYSKTWPVVAWASVTADSYYTPIGNYTWTVKVYCTANGVKSSTVSKSTSGTYNG